MWTILFMPFLSHLQSWGIKIMYIKFKKCSSFRGLTPYRGFAPDPHWRTSVPQTPWFWPPRCQILNTPLYIYYFHSSSLGLWLQLLIIELVPFSRLYKCSLNSTRCSYRVDSISCWLYVPSVSAGWCYCCTVVNDVLQCRRKLNRMQQAIYKRIKQASAGQWHGRRRQTTIYIELHHCHRRGLPGIPPLSQSVSQLQSRQLPQLRSSSGLRTLHRVASCYSLAVDSITGVDVCGGKQRMTVAPPI